MTKTKKRTRRVFDTKDKITAVLSIRTEQKHQSQACSEMKISWTLIDRCQNQAMEGKLVALSPKKKALQRRQLNPHLVQLIDKKLDTGNLIKLNKQMIHKTEEIKFRYQVADAPLMAAVGINISTYKRWKRRIRAGADTVQKPGAKKVAPIVLDILEQQIERLNSWEKAQRRHQ